MIEYYGRKFDPNEKDMTKVATSEFLIDLLEKDFINGDMELMKIGGIRGALKDLKEEGDVKSAMMKLLPLSEIIRKENQFVYNELMRLRKVLHK